MLLLHAGGIGEASLERSPKHVDCSLHLSVVDEYLGIVYIRFGKPGIFLYEIGKEFVGLFPIALQDVQPSTIVPDAGA
ncbi:hypothetical protein DSECCO2_530660 [anaerobic digester metagenome]